jgi:hypothetical protein
MYSLFALYRQRCNYLQALRGVAENRDGKIGDAAAVRPATRCRTADYLDNHTHRLKSVKQEVWLYLYRELLL